MGTDFVCSLLGSLCMLYVALCVTLTIQLVCVCRDLLGTPTSSHAGEVDEGGEPFSFPVTPPSEPATGPVFGFAGFGRASSGGLNSYPVRYFLQLTCPRTQLAQAHIAHAPDCNSDVAALAAERCQAKCTALGC
jgi:hypothetical protein